MTKTKTDIVMLFKTKIKTKTKSARRSAIMLITTVDTFEHAAKFGDKVHQREPCMKLNKECFEEVYIRFITVLSKFKVGRTLQL